MPRKFKWLLSILLILVIAAVTAALNAPAILAFLWRAPDYLTSLAMLVPLDLEAGSMMPRGGSFEYLTVGQRTVLPLQAKLIGFQSPHDIEPKDVRFTVKQTNGAPAIRFDPATGTIETLRLGDALIESRYKYTNQTTCVMVRETEGYEDGNCEELRPGGDGVLRTAKGSDAPGALWNSVLPYRAADDLRRGRFVADDRVEIEAPASALTIAQDNVIQMKVNGSTVVRVECEAADQPCVARDDYNKPVPSFTFEQQKDGEIAVRVFPTRLDALEFSFTVLFADGGVAHKSVTAKADFGNTKPRGINMPCGNDSYQNPNLPQRLYAPYPGEAPTATTDLWINACLNGIPGFIVLPANRVTYRVIGGDGEPVIQVDDATGQVTALRPGMALLEREFRGLKSDTCFVVVSPGQPDKNLPNCEPLREHK